MGERLPAHQHSLSLSPSLGDHIHVVWGIVQCKFHKSNVYVNSIVNKVYIIPTREVKGIFDANFVNNSLTVLMGRRCSTSSTPKWFFTFVFLPRYINFKRAN